AFVGHLLTGGWFGFAIGAFAGAAAFGIHGASYLLAGGVINGYGHASTQRSRESGYAKNMPVIAYLTVGEGWHRNAPAGEHSPRFGSGHQFGLGGPVLAPLRTFPLADIPSRGAAGLQRLQAWYASS